MKVNAISASGAHYDTNKLGLEKKIKDADKKVPDIIGLVKKDDYNTKISEIEGKIPSIAGLAENKIPNVSNLVKKTDYGSKISDIESQCCTTSDYNKFTHNILDAKIKEKGLVDKFAICNRSCSFIRL